MEVALRSKIALCFLATVCLLVSSTQATTVDYCTKKLYHVKVNDVVISPYPVEPGKPTTFTIKAFTYVPIRGGKVVLAVSYFGVKVHSETDDLCETTSCPVMAGEFELSHTQTLPLLTPPGLYTLKLRIYDDKNLELTCISFKFRIGAGSYLESV